MSYKIGVLSFHNSKETKAILNSIRKLGHDPVWIREENLNLKMSDGVKISPEVDIVINRLLLSKEDRPIELLGLAEALPVKLTNKPENVMKALNKITSTSIINQTEGASTPESLFGNLENMKEFTNERDEAILKRAIGTHGAAVKKTDEINDIFSNVDGSYTLIQDVVEQTGNNNDVRAYVVDGDIIASMRREAKEGEWRANIARGGEAYIQNIPEDIQDTIRKVCKSHKLDYAGVDLMKDQEDNWYFIEVNPTAGFKGLFKATGVNPAPYIAKHAIEKVGGEIDEELVKNLSMNLDDSKPSCKPDIQSEERPTIGVEEVVQVSGYDDSLSVKAKVDTGASRTSIDIELASKLGVGPIRDYTTVRTGSTKSKKLRPVIPLTIVCGGSEKVVDASIEDRRHMNYDLILGRDIITEYDIHTEEGEIEEDIEEE